MARNPSKTRLERMLDVRVRDRYLGDRSIDEAMVEKYLDSLDDCAELAQYVDLPEVERKASRPGTEGGELGKD